MILDEAKRKSVQKAKCFLDPGDLRSGMTLQASKRSAEWWFCPKSFVTRKCKPGTEPCSASWSNPDTYAPQACNTLGRAGLVWRELYWRVERLTESSEGNQRGKILLCQYREKARRKCWLMDVFPHVETGTVRSAPHTLSGILRNKERLYPRIGFNLFERIQRTDYNSYVLVVKIKQCFFAISCGIQ